MRVPFCLSVLSAVALQGAAAIACPLRDDVRLGHPSAREVGAGYGMAQHPLLGVERLHTGLDYAGPMGDEVVAAAAGLVVSASPDGAAGNAIVIRHSAGLETRYHHLARFAVTAGACVAAGQPIAGIGTTGLSTHPHLHFEVVRDGRAVDPLPLLPSR